MRYQRVVIVKLLGIRTQITLMLKMRFLRSLDTLDVTNSS